MRTHKELKTKLISMFLNYAESIIEYCSNHRDGDPNQDVTYSDGEYFLDEKKHNPMCVDCKISEYEEIFSEDEREYLEELIFDAFELEENIVTDYYGDRFVSLTKIEALLNVDEN